MSVGIIGVGKWGRRLLEQFTVLDKVSCFNTSGIDSTNIDFMKGNYPDIPFKETEEILKSDQVSTVVIATPIDTHYELCLKALESKKNVFIEKPLTTSLKQAEVLNKIAQKNNLVLFVGNKFLYHPMVEKVKELDKIHNFHAHFVWNKWGTFKEDILWNLITHDLILAIELFGAPKSISYKKKYCDDIVSIWLDYEDRKRMSISHNRLTKNKIKYISLMSSTNEGKNYQWEEDKLIYLPKKHVKFDFENTNLVELECVDFLNKIKNKEVVDNTNVLKSIELLESLT